MQPELRKATREGLEALRVSLRADNLTCHIYNPYSELYWLFEKSGDFRFPYQLSGPLTHPGQNKRFTVPSTFFEEQPGIRVDFFNPVESDLKENVLEGESFANREGIRRAVRIRLSEVCPRPQPQIFIFVNFRSAAQPVNDKILIPALLEKVSVLRPFLLELARRPRLDQGTAWRLRSLNMRLRNELGKLLLLSQTNLTTAMKEVFDGIAQAVAEVLVQPIRREATNLFCTLSTVDADNNIRTVGRHPANLEIPDQPGIVHYVAHTGQLFFVPNIEEYRARHINTPSHPCLPPYVQCQAEAACELAVPLIIQSRVVGVINIEADKAEAFDDSHVLLLCQFASTVALLFRLVTMSTDLNVTVRLQRELLDCKSDEDVFHRILESFQELGYRLPAIWDATTQRWIKLEADRWDRGRPRQPGFTEWVIQQQKPVALADMRRTGGGSVSYDRYVGRVDNFSGCFKEWTKANEAPLPDYGINPEVSALLDSEAPILTDFAFPIFTDSIEPTRQVRAVVWAKCKRFFTAVLPDECWFLSLFCQTASVALKVLDERRETDRLRQERYERAEVARALVLEFHFGSQHRVVFDAIASDPLALQARAVDNVIVLNVDIRRSTSVTEAVMNAQAGEAYRIFIHAYQAMVREAVLTAGGVFDKTMGDGAQALFNVYRQEILGPNFHPTLRTACALHEEMRRAIDCAHDIFQKFNNLIDAHRQQLNIALPEDFALGAGLSVGKAFVGGFYSPAEIPGFDYSAHGPPANQAAKLQTCARARELADALSVQFTKDPKAIWRVPNPPLVSPWDFDAIVTVLRTQRQSVLLAHPAFNAALPTSTVAAGYMVPIDPGPQMALLVF